MYDVAPQQEGLPTQVTRMDSYKSGFTCLGYTDKRWSAVYMERCLERRLCGIALYILSFPNASLVVQKKKSILFGCTRKEITLVHWQGRGLTFSLECWQHLNINWRFDLDFHPMMEEAKQQCSNSFFMETFIIGARLIWKQRNDFIFNKGGPSFQNWKHGFIEKLSFRLIELERIRDLFSIVSSQLYR
jgi:hypothetical protein